MRYVIGLLALAFASASGAQVDNATINRIVDEALNQSEIPADGGVPHRSHRRPHDELAGRCARPSNGRRSSSATWGLTNVRAEGFEFGRGWSIERIEARMVTPRVLAMQRDSRRVDAADARAP